MKEYKLSGEIIKEIKRLPLAEITAKNLEEAEKEYLKRYVKIKPKKGFVIKIKNWSEEEIDKAISKHILENKD